MVFSFLVIFSSFPDRIFTTRVLLGESERRAQRENALNVLIMLRI